MQTAGRHEMPAVIIGVMRYNLVGKITSRPILDEKTTWVVHLFPKLSIHD